MKCLQLWNMYKTSSSNRNWSILLCHRRSIYFFCVTFVVTLIALQPAINYEYIPTISMYIICNNWFVSNNTQSTERRFKKIHRYIIMYCIFIYIRKFHKPQYRVIRENVVYLYFPSIKQNKPKQTRMKIIPWRKPTFMQALAYVWRLPILSTVSKRLLHIVLFLFFHLNIEPSIFGLCLATAVRTVHTDGFVPPYFAHAKLSRREGSTDRPET